MENKGENKNTNENGMFNWTHDVPKNTKQHFLNALQLLQHHPNPRILEIGTFTGVSIIEMLKVLPNASGTVIDNWKLDLNELTTCKKYSSNFNTDIRGVFLQNIKMAGVDKRIEILEGNSCDILRNLLRDKRRFDFIYVDGSHQCLDVLTDLILSWELLNKNGIFGIDDVAWTGYGNDWNIPLPAVTHFTAKYQNEFVMVSGHYRLFLRKTV